MTPNQMADGSYCARRMMAYAAIAEREALRALDDYAADRRDLTDAEHACAMAIRARIDHVRAVVGLLTWVGCDERPSLWSASPPTSDPRGPR